MKQFIAQALIVHRSTDPTVNDNLGRGFDVESEWYNGVKFWKLISFSGSYANWSLVGSGGGSSFDPAVDTVGNITPTNSVVLDDDTVTVAIGKLQGQLDVSVVQKTFTLDFDGVEDTFEKTHNYYNDYITYSIRKADGSYYKETEYDVRSTTTTFTVAFVTPPAAGTGKLTLQSVQKEAPSGGGGIGTGIIGSTFIVG